jgi:peptidoglycan hydrolase-like protein with peptidoglycan-binding domain
MGDRLLREGMSGHDVRVLQDFLTRDGFPTTIDGSFGPTTQRNVIRFQRSVNMPPDGVVTYDVQKALRLGHRPGQRAGSGQERDRRSEQDRVHAVRVRRRSRQLHLQRL